MTYIDHNGKVFIRWADHLVRAQLVGVLQPDRGQISNVFPLDRLFQFIEDNNYVDVK